MHIDGQCCYGTSIKTRLGLAPAVIIADLQIDNDIPSRNNYHVPAIRFFNAVSIPSASFLMNFLTDWPAV